MLTFPIDLVFYNPHYYYAVFLKVNFSFFYLFDSLFLSLYCIIRELNFYSNLKAN